MSQLDYLIRVRPMGSKRYQVRQWKLHRVTFTEEKRVVKTVSGLFNVTEGTGKFDKSNLELWGDGYILHVRSADEAKETIRRLRPEERERLDAIDAEIERLRAERLEVLKIAWAKAHVVTYKELKDIAK